MISGCRPLMQADFYDIDTVEVLRGPQGTTITYQDVEVLFDDTYVIAANDFGVFYLSGAEIAAKIVHAAIPSGHRTFGVTASRQF